MLASWYWPPRYVVRALAICWCGSFAIVIPASLVAYQSGLHLAPWLQDTARQRIIIWEYTAEQVFRHPLLGVGVEATPVLNKQHGSAAERPEGFVHPRKLGSHAHNIYLQAWFDLGALGAILLAIAGAIVLVQITLLPASAQPFAAGTFATFALIGTFAWGMWQAWFMCAIALLPIYLRIGAATSRNN